MLRRPATAAGWVAAALFAAAPPPNPAAAQSLREELRLGGYYLNVATASLEGPFTPAGVTDFQRLRLMTAPDLGPLRLDIAYEQGLELVSDPGLGLTPGLGASSSGIDWLPLQWTIEDWDHGSWRHRFDRLLVIAPLGESAEATVGRQTISWATSLIFTPADPFVPFDPADPFREFRAGVDALRIQGFSGPFTELDFVLRPADTRDGTTITALGRITTASGPWEVSGWAGVLHDGGAVSAAATLTAAGTAFRGEAELRWPDDVLRFTIGADRSFPLAGRDMYVVLEYQRDGYGATDPDGYLDVLLSDPYSRGELQVIGRNETALQASWQASPLLTADFLTTWNMNDGSFLLSPAATYSLSNEAYLRGGFFFGIGAGEGSTVLPIGGEESGFTLPGSEYGIVPSSLYLSLTAFF
ncbi:MAG: hypothetical protein KJO06_10985 [Gemmatimonadetes bacterium]|nr:hypothetical protein [Gemmatimonadota bacterium]